MISRTNVNVESQRLILSPRRLGSQHAPLPQARGPSRGERHPAADLVCVFGAPPHPLGGNNAVEGGKYKWPSVERQAAKKAKGKAKAI